MKPVRFLLCLLFFVPSAAQARSGSEFCTVDFQRVQFPSLIIYDVFSGQDILEPVRLTLKNRNNTPCSINIAYYTGRDKKLYSDDKDQMNYHIRSRNGDDLDGNYNPSRNIRVTVPANADNYDVEMGVFIPAGQIVSSGLYQQRAELRLYGGENAGKSAGNLIESRNVNVAVDVFAQTGITLAGSAGTPYSSGRSNAIMDFGLLEEGESKDIFLKVRSNQAYRMAFASQNRGKLVNTKWPEQFVSYNASLQNQPLDLEKGAEIPGKKKVTSSHGDAHRMAVQIGSTENRQAGLYRDTVSINVFPVE
jgi:hypothetical protein